jgi:hypothetical protein
MSDIYKRILTGVIAAILLYIILQVYLLQVILIFTVLVLTAKEYYFIMGKAYKKYLDAENAYKESRLVLLMPLLFLASSFIGCQDAIVSLSLIINLVAFIISRLHEYSLVCVRKPTADPIKAYAFLYLAAIMGDLLFCVFISFPLSHALLILNLK